MSITKKTEQLIKNIQNFFQIRFLKDKKVRNICWISVLSLLLIFSILVILEISLIYTYKIFILSTLGVLVIMLFLNSPMKYQRSIFQYKKIAYLSILVIALIGGSYLRFRNLETHSFKEDEFQVVATAKGYMETDHFYRWNWLEDESEISKKKEDELNTYTRAPLHTIIVAQSFQLLGVSEFSARLPSVIFGIATILITFFVAKFFTQNNLLSSIISLSVALSPELIIIAQYTRMYALTIPMLLLSVIPIYKGLFSKRKHKDTNFFYKYFDFDYKNLILGIIIFLIAVSLHINCLVLGLAIIPFLIYKYFESKEKRYLAISILSISGLVLLVFALYTLPFLSEYLTIFKLFISFFKQNNYVYLSYITSYPLPTVLGIFSLALSTISLFITNLPKELKDKKVFVLTITLVSIFFFAFIADRYPTYNYISIFVPFGMICVFNGYYSLLYTFNKHTKIPALLFSFAVVLFSILSWYQSREYIYGQEGRGNFKEAYMIIKEDFNQYDDAIYAQYIRDYYLTGSTITTKHTKSLGHDKNMSLEEFFEKINREDSGYITWESRKGTHLEKDIRDYCCENLKQLAGNSCGEVLDDYNVEIFYFNNN